MAKVMVVDNEVGLIMSISTQLNLSNSRGLDPRGLNSIPIPYKEKSMEQSERLLELNRIAIQQMKVLEGVEERRMLK